MSRTTALVSHGVLFISTEPPVARAAARPPLRAGVRRRCCSRMPPPGRAAAAARACDQFEFPLALDAANWSTVAAADVFNSDGGSIARLASGRYWVAFTAMSCAHSDAGSCPRVSKAAEATTAYEASQNGTIRSSYAFELSSGDDDGNDDDGDDAAASAARNASRGDGNALRNASSGGHTHSGGTPRVFASLEIPIPADEVKYQNGYRVVPWSSIVGESAECPWGVRR